MVTFVTSFTAILGIQNEIIYLKKVQKKKKNVVMVYSELVTFDSRKGMQEPGHKGHGDLG